MIRNLSGLILGNPVIMQRQLHRSPLFTDETVGIFFTCSNFEDIFDVRHFIDSVRDEVRIIKRLPKRFGRRYGYQTLAMAPISWSNEKYYLEQVWIFLLEKSCMN